VSFQGVIRRNPEPEEEGKDTRTMLGASGTAGALEKEENLKRLPAG